MPDISREHSDPHATGEPPFVLDRQRVIHSAAFRRLEYKTQVFVALEGDHYRTRLTHTLEVAHLARRIAASLDLDPDLAEAVALAHDLGHAPFGHAGERALDECLQAHGGFEHNTHSLRVVEYLEHPYPQFRGLNLTHAVRECLAKHSTQFDRPGPHPLQDGRPPPAEGQAADLADRLAYGLHDLQDGLYAGLIEPAALAELALWREAYDGPAITGSAWRGHVRPAMDRIQQRLLQDAQRESLSLSAGGAVGSRVRLSAAADAQFAELESFLLHQLYRHTHLVRMDAKARRTIVALFEEYVREPNLMPARFAQRIGAQGPQRVAADYIAGMTDRFALTEHARLFDPRMGV